MELFRVLQRANLTIYYEAFIAQGGDDVPQLAECSDEEFMEIVRVVGMANKPLHVRRLQKALMEWKLNPEAFRTGGISGSSSTPEVRQTPPVAPLPPLHQPHAAYQSPPPQQAPPTSIHPPHPSISNSNALPLGQFSNTSTPSAPSIPVFPSLMTSAASSSRQFIPLTFRAPQSALPLPPQFVNKSITEEAQRLDNTLSLDNILPLLTGTKTGKGVNKKEKGVTKLSHVRGIPVSLLPNATLTQEQRSQITLAAEELTKCVPDYPIKEPAVRTKKNRALMEVIHMLPSHPQRLAAIYKYSAIYGRFDRPRKTGKAMNHHEVSVNEAAAQLALRMPSLLSRREDLYPLARQVVKIAEDACRDIIRTKQQKKKAKKSLVNSIAHQISTFYANNPEAGVSTLQEKIDRVKGELREIMNQLDALRQAYLTAKGSGSNGVGTMTEIQKQVDNLSALQQVKMSEQARLIQEVRRFRAAMDLGQSLTQHDASDDVGNPDFSESINLDENSSESQEQHENEYLFGQPHHAEGDDVEGVDGASSSGNCISMLSLFSSRVKLNPHPDDEEHELHHNLHRMDGSAPDSAGSLSPGTAKLLMSIFPSTSHEKEEQHPHSTTSSAESAFQRFSTCLPVFPSFPNVNKPIRSANEEGTNVVTVRKCEPSVEPTENFSALFPDALS